MRRNCNPLKSIDIILCARALCPAGMKLILILKAIPEGKRENAKRIGELAQQSECFIDEADASLPQFLSGAADVEYAEK